MSFRYYALSEDTLFGSYRLDHGYQPGMVRLFRKAEFADTTKYKDSKATGSYSVQFTSKEFLVNLMDGIQNDYARGDTPILAIVKSSSQLRRWPFTPINKMMMVRETEIDSSGQELVLTGDDLPTTFLVEALQSDDLLSR